MPALLRRGALLLALGPALAPPSAWAGNRVLQVVGFSDDLALQVGEALIRLEPGSPVFSVPSDARVSVLAGSAILVIDGIRVNADQGDVFVFSAAQDPPQLRVEGGAIEVVYASGRSLPLGAGQFLSLPAAGAAAPEAVPPAPAPVPAPAAAAPAPVAPAAPAPAPFDPLGSLARGMDRLSRWKGRKLQLVIEAHPYLRVKESYDSNIYLVPADRDGGGTVGGGVLGSWITTAEGGSKFLLPMGRDHKLDTGLNIRHVSYTQQPRANDALDYSLSSGYRYSGKKGVEASLTEAYANTQDPAFSELVARQRRVQNSVAARLDVRRSRAFVFGLGADHSLHKYLDPTLALALNRYELAVGGNVGVLVQPKTKLYVAYRRELVHYSAGRSNHSKSHRVGAGVDGVLAPRLTGSIQGDWHQRRYDAAAAGARATVASFLTDLKLRYQASPRTKVDLGVFRNLNESTFGASRFYHSTGVSLGASHAYHKVTLGANGSFAVDRYPEAATVGGLAGFRRDDLYTFGVDADYKPRPWLGLGLAYSRLARHSIFSGQFNYVAHRTTASLRLDF